LPDEDPDVRDVGSVVNGTKSGVWDGVCFDRSGVSMS
jgi:hypothetical protein